MFIKPEEMEQGKNYIDSIAALCFKPSNYTSFVCFITSEFPSLDYSANYKTYGNFSGIIGDFRLKGQVVKL